MDPEILIPYVEIQSQLEGKQHVQWMLFRRWAGGQSLWKMKSHPPWYKISQLFIRIQLMRGFTMGKRDVFGAIWWRHGFSEFCWFLRSWITQRFLMVILTCQKIPFFSSKSAKCSGVFYICWIWIIAILGRRFRLFSRFCFKIWICCLFSSHCW